MSNKNCPVCGEQVRDNGPLEGGDWIYLHEYPKYCLEDGGAIESDFPER